MHGFLIALLAALLFGASTPASKLLLETLHPFQLAGLLYLGAAMAMAPFVRYGRGRPGADRLDGASRLRLGGAVVLGGIVGPVLLLAGLRLATAGSVSLLLNLEMAATAILGVVIFREHLTAGGWLGAAGVVAAGAMLSWQEGWPGLAAGVLVAGACVCWGLDNHLTALIDGMTPTQSTFWKGLVAGSANSIIGLAVAPLSFAPGLLGALLVGALSYGASIALYITAAQKLGATRAQGVFASAPFIGAALSFALLAEPLTAGHAVAALVCSSAVVLLAASRHHHSHGHQWIEHVHSHRHDDGHHEHAHGEIVSGTHSHWHSHESVVHAHAHWPDLHHRHVH